VLPDFPQVKKKILQQIAGAINQYPKQDQFLGSMSRLVQHEGDRTTLEREDGSTSIIDYAEPIEAVATLSTEDIRRHGPVATQKVVRELARDIAQGLAQRAIKKFEEATDEVGNTVDAKGEPFSAELHLEVLRKLRLTFADDGTWVIPQLAAHPKHKDKIEAVLREAGKDPAFVAERDKIVNQQREEWRAREANRRLVD